MNNRSLKGKSVLIGGGAKNLGGLISRTFANDGARICVHYNSASTKKEGQSRSALPVRLTRAAVSRVRQCARASSGFSESLMPNNQCKVRHRLGTVDRVIWVCLAFGVMLIGIAAPISSSSDRMPPIAPEKYDGAQKKAAEEFLAPRKEPVFGPFSVLIRSPELMNAYRTFGDYLRFKASAGNKLTEFIILVTAREWTQDFEWNFTFRSRGRKSAKTSCMSEDVEICYNLVTELQRYKRVSDPTYARAVKRFGEKGVLDIVGITGYYASLAMVMNTTRMSMPPGGKRLSRFPE